MVSAPRHLSGLSPGRWRHLSLAPVRRKQRDAPGEFWRKDMGTIGDLASGFIVIYCDLMGFMGIYRGYNGIYHLDPSGYD